jgi:hypothetical protein
MQSRRHQQRWIMWLLPLFILRAFVPLGFMWSNSPDGLQLVPCSGVSRNAPAEIVALASQQAEHGAHAHAHHGAGHEQHQDGPNEPSHQSSLCPFAGAGFSFIDAVVATAAEFTGSASVAIPSLSDPALDRGPIDLHRIRGPPVLIHIA